MKKVLYTVLCLSSCACCAENAPNTSNVDNKRWRISLGVYGELGQFGYEMKMMDKADSNDKQTKLTRRALGGVGGLCVGYVYYHGRMRLYGEGKVGTGFNTRVYSNGAANDILKRGFNVGCCIGCGYQPVGSNWYVSGMLYLGYEECKYVDLEDYDRRIKEKQKIITMVKDGGIERYQNKEGIEAKWKNKGVVHFMPCLEIGYDNKNMNVALHFGMMMNAGGKVVDDYMKECVSEAQVKHGFYGGVKLCVLI